MPVSNVSLSKTLGKLFACILLLVVCVTLAICAVGDHVWLGYGATLLGNASIGDNSVVGTMAVTSGSFPEEVVLAGSPARIVREGVLWSKDNTEFYNREDLDSCLAREALKYL